MGVAFTRAVFDARAVLTLRAFHGYVLVVALVVRLVFWFFRVMLGLNVLDTQEVVPWGRGRLLCRCAFAGRAGRFGGIALSCSRRPGQRHHCVGIEASAVVWWVGAIGT